MKGPLEQGKVWDKAFEWVAQEERVKLEKQQRFIAGWLVSVFPSFTLVVFPL